MSFCTRRPLSSVAQMLLKPWLATTSLSFSHLLIAACGLVATETPAEAAIAPPPTAFAPLIAAAAGHQPGVTVLTRTDLQNLMGLETEKQLIGCETDSCLAEISDALGADLVLFLAVDQLGDAIVLSTTLHTAQAELLGRRVLQGVTAQEISAKIPALVDDLVGGHLKKLNRKPNAAKLKMLINYKDPPAPAVTAPVATTNADMQAAIAAAQKAAEEATAEAMRQAEAAQARAIEAARYPPLGYLHDVADVVFCLEVGVPRILQSEGRYRSWREQYGDVEPTCKERYVSYGLYQGYDHAIEPCRKAAENAPASMRDDVKRLSDAITNALPIIAKAETYYDDEDYLEDDCKLGRALHPQLMKSFSAVRAAAVSTTQKLDPIAIKRTATAKGSERYRALGAVVHAVMKVAALAPITGDDALDDSAAQALLAASADVRTAIEAALALPPPATPDGKSAWTSTASRLEDEARWWKVTTRALRKDAAKRNAKTERGFDPTKLRIRGWVLARELANALPLEDR